MKTFSVYYKKVPTNDDLVRTFPELKSKMDIAVYRDANCKTEWVRFPWHYSNKPKWNSKTVMINCFKWQVIWVK